MTVDPDILGGKPVFKGTRVPVKTFFDGYPAMANGAASQSLAASPLVFPGLRIAGPGKEH